jgi:hypothetical protein
VIANQEIPVARAKRTDRAEARRRFRAQQVADPDLDDELDDDATAPAAARPAAAAAPGRGSSPTPAAPRPGIGAAFRGAFRSANLREDLAHLPQIFLARSMWLTALLILAVVGTILAFEGQEVISKVLFPYVLLPPQIGAIFIVGFFAPRASYLSGALIAAFATTCLAFAVVTSPLAVARALGYTGLADGSASPAPSEIPSPAPTIGSSAPVSASPAASGSGVAPSASTLPSAAPGASPTPRLPTPQDLRSGLAESYITAILGGVMFASAAAWYRRFLYLANPNRGQRRPPPGRGGRNAARSAARR